MRKTVWALWPLLTICQLAYAHEPIIPLLRCWHETAEVVCEARWSHDVAAPHARFEVTDVQDKTLLAGQTDSQGRLSFVPPVQRFYVLVWDASDAMAEAGWKDIQGGK